jgi:hypothetical protein
MTAAPRVATLRSPQNAPNRVKGTGARSSLGNAPVLSTRSRIMIRTVGRTIGLSLLYAAAVEFPLALCFWYVGIPAARPTVPALLLAFSQLPGVIFIDSLQMWQGEPPLVAANNVLRPTLEHTGVLALLNTVVLALLVYIVLRTAEAFAAGAPLESESELAEVAPAAESGDVATIPAVADARPVGETVAA